MDDYIAKMIKKRRGSGNLGVNNQRYCQYRTVISIRVGYENILSERFEDIGKLADIIVIVQNQSVVIQIGKIKNESLGVDQKA